MRYFAFLLSLFLPILVFAQNSQVDVTLSLIPSNPAPGSTFTVMAESYGVDLDLVNMSWTYNDKIIVSGIGKKSVKLTAPRAGVVNTIVLRTSGGGFDPVVSTISVRPASVDLIWEAADAYTPPFYKGKAPVPPGGLIRVGALTAIGSPKGVSYNWSQNDSALPSLSGYNKSSIVVKNDLLKSGEKFSVEVAGGLFAGQGNISISTKSPLLVLYQNRDGFIDYANGTTGSISLSGNGTILHFEPYFFSVPKGIQKDLSLELSENGNVIPTGSKVTELGVTRPEAGGQSELRAVINTVNYSLQHFDKIFTINFN